MNWQRVAPLAGAMASMLTAAAPAVTLINKPPDLGAFWQPVSNGGTYVYADSFVCPPVDTQVSQLGTWLNYLNPGLPPSDVQFQVWGDAGGPDPGNVLASTATFSTSTQGLTKYMLPVVSGGGPLTPGNTYWFVITGVGLGAPGNGAYQVGGHTQNSVYPDNGTFWYSNDPAGIAFDGQNLTPEMAFQVELVGAGGQVNFFTDPFLFQEALINTDKVGKFTWDFSPNALPPASVIGLSDLLDINSHAGNPGDPWTDPVGNDLWPPDVDNVQFSSNTTPGGPLTPAGANGLAFATPGFGGADNNVLVANTFVHAFDIISGPPAGDNHTAFAMELVSFFAGGVVVVTVYDKKDVPVGVFDVFVPPPPGKAFLGILRKDRQTIGRIEIFSPSGEAEGISMLQAFLNAGEECTVFTNKDEFDTFNLQDGKVLKGEEIFEPPVGNVLPGQIVGLPGDPLMGNVPNVDPNGFGFPNGLFNKNMLIQSNALGPNAPFPQPGGGLVAIGPGALGFQCPWDCEVPPDGAVGIGDLLDLLAQWGGPGPCDFDGGGVGITDLLKLLANWGPCPGGIPIPNSIVVGSNSFGDSTDLIFTDDDNHTGVGFDVIDPISAPLGGAIHISVFDKQEIEMAKVIIPADDRKQFFGIWCPNTIGRINIAGVGPDGFGGELVDNIQLWREPLVSACNPPGTCDTGFVPCDPTDPNCVCFTLSDGTGFCGQSVACAGLVPCAGGTCPPGFVCQVATCCGVDICVPDTTACDGVSAPPMFPPGTLTTTGVAKGGVKPAVFGDGNTLPK